MLQLPNQLTLWEPDNIVIMLHRMFKISTVLFCQYVPHGDLRCQQLISALYIGLWSINLKCFGFLIQLTLFGSFVGNNSKAQICIHTSNVYCGNEISVFTLLILHFGSLFFFYFCFLFLQSHHIIVPCLYITTIFTHL